MSTENGNNVSSLSSLGSESNVAEDGAEANLSFESVEAEVEYLRQKYKDVQKELRFVTNSFVEFQKMSEDYEKQLELDLEACEEKVQEANSKNNALQEDLRNLKNQVRQTSSNSGQDLQKAIDEIEVMKEEKNQMMDKIQRLEQENDDLIRHLRITKASVENLTEKLQEETENNVILQGELEMLEEYRVSVQRLKDEKKEMEIELSVLSNKSIMADDNDYIVKEMETLREQYQTPLDSLKEKEDIISTLRAEIVQLQSSVKELTPNVSPDAQDISRPEDNGTTNMDIEEHDESTDIDTSDKEDRELFSRILSLAERVEARLRTCQQIASPI